MNKLSKRLQAIYDLVKPCEKLVEIGCDHCWLPIFLQKNGIVQSAIASDINHEPLEACKLNIKNSGDLNITTKISDGFKNIKQDFNCAIIAGMGGKLISSIIDGLKKPDSYQLILQPQNNESFLRRYLQSNNLSIEKEVLIEDNRFVYTIISLSPKGVLIKDDVDVYIGPILKLNKDNVARKKFGDRLNHLNKIVKHIPNPEKNIKIKREIEIIKKYLES